VATGFGPKKQNPRLHEKASAAIFAITISELSGMCMRDLILKSAMFWFITYKAWNNHEENKNRSYPYFVQCLFYMVAS
jgi:hypothetical protein